MGLVPTTLAAALAKVDIKLEDVVDAGGSVLAAGSPFLVGSLAQGFGNRGSDVDIHLFVADLDHATPPFLIFIGDVPVDIEHLPAVLPTTLVDALGDATLSTDLGPLALGTGLKRGTRTKLTRWLTALPLHDDSPQLLSAPQQARVYPHLLRFALGRLLVAAAMAEIATRAGTTADYPWRLCGRALLDLLCTAAGLPPIGDKWLPGRVRLADLPEELITTATRIRGLDDLRRALRRCGGPDVDPLMVTAVRRHPAVRDVRLGRQTYLHTGFGRLERPESLPVGRCTDLLARQSAIAIVDLLRAGVLQVSLDDAGLDRSLAA